MMDGPRVLWRCIHGPAARNQSTVTSVFWWALAMSSWMTVTSRLEAVQILSEAIMSWQVVVSPCCRWIHLPIRGFTVWVNDSSASHPIATATFPAISALPSFGILYPFQVYSFSLPHTNNVFHLSECSSGLRLSWRGCTRLAPLSGKTCLPSSDCSHTLELPGLMLCKVISDCILSFQC